MRGRSVGPWFLGIVTALGSASFGCRPGAAPMDRSVAIAADRRVLDADIEFFRARAARDPTGALDRIQLGARLLRRGRATGEPADFQAAEAVARAAIRHQGRRGGAGWQLLSAALMSQHRFIEALGAADSLVAMEPESPSATAVRGEALLELGRYPDADRVFRSLWIRRGEPALAIRVARWLEIRGRLPEARDLLAEARATLDRTELPADQRAWFALRQGELALKAGATREAARWLDRGLEESPGDGRLLSARARLALERGDPREAVRWGDLALAARPDPVTLGILAAAWTELGDSSKARDYEAAIDATGGLALPGFDRRYGLYLLDRGERVADVLAAATREARDRQDVGTLDLLGWAEFRSGHARVATAILDRALGWNPGDSLLIRHRRAIRAATEMAAR